MLPALCRIALALGILACPAFSVIGEAKDPIRTQNVAEAGPDYAVQGEYIGSLEREGEAEIFGVQVIARGKGAFEAKGYHGGLPGAGWDQRDRLEFAGKTEGTRTELKMASVRGGELWLLIQDRRLEVQDSSRKTVGRLERVIRKSPTLGMKPPEGAVVLFDGKTASSFLRHGDRKPAEMNQDGLLRLTPGSGGLDTAKSFGSCRLHLEFRLPFEPEGAGQGRANSGCYLQGRYEVQILDSFGEKGLQDECGGMYSSGVNPRVNMCFPPLTWQTFDIEFTAPKFDEKGKKIESSPARMTVCHNGVPVYVGQEIKWTTTAAPVGTETPEPMPLYLQDHGHELVFRNIWLVETK